jgi:hypothetical protein
MVMCNFCYIQGQAQKTDTIFLKNKDRIIGEIKDMRNGVLTVETDYSDQDFKITWIDIQKIDSKQTFIISLKGGERLHSTIRVDSTDVSKIILQYANLNIATTIKDIVYVKSLESTFLSRLDASLSFGYNYTKSNNLSQLTVRSTLGYTANSWSGSATYNSVRSDQTDTDQIQRTDGDVSFRYFLKKDYFLSVKSEFLSNDEQKLELRVNTKGGLGKYFVHNNRVYFGGITGLGWNNERYKEPEGSRNSMESYITLELNMFDIKDFSLLTNGSGYLSLTEKNRTRGDFKIDLKYDLPLDFFIKLGLTYNYDSQPIEGAAYDDYVFQTTFGWEL